MKYVKMFGLLAVAAAALMAFAATASATTVTSPTGTTYTGTIHAESEGTTSLHSEVTTVSCTSSTVHGHLTSHGPGLTAKGPITSLVFGGCNFTVTVLAPGELELHAAGTEHVLTSTGARITIHGPFGINCLYETNKTKVGILTDSHHTSATSAGKETHATLDIASSLIPRVGDSAFCGANGEWTGSYTVKTPATLYVDA